MTKISRGVLVACAALALPLAACQKQEDDFGQKVRAYLLAHPEVIEEAVVKLQQNKEGAAHEAARASLAQYRDQLERDPRDFVANPNGSITVVEFFDYNCGYCKRPHPLIQQLLAEDKDIRYIYKQFPILSETSYYAARAALAVKLGQPDKYQAFHDKLYAHQGPLSDEAQVKDVARAAGVDWSKVEAKIKDGSIDQNLGTNRALAEAMSISGTPAFIIGDQILRGAPRDLASLKGFIKDVRAGKSIQ